MSRDIKNSNARVVVDPSADRIVRWGMLAIGIGMALVAVALRIWPGILPQGNLVISELLARVAIVMVSGWLAWPAIQSVREAPGGILVLVIGFATTILFVARPRSLYFTAPILIAASIGVVVLGWFRKLR